MANNTNSTNNELRLGLEVESLLSLLDTRTMGTEDFSELVVQYWNANKKNELGIHTDFFGLYTGPAFKEWSITWDATVVGEIKNKKHALEIVSPILHFNKTGSWRSQIVRSFEILESICKIESNQSCGFHVHFSPATRGWSVGEVQNICIAILHFETAFGSILPEARWGNFWAKTFKNSNPTFRDLTLAQCFNLIRGCKTLENLADLMNPLLVQRHGSEMVNDRYYSWNFENLKRNTKATIEWRQPEGMSTPQGCIAWMELGTNFILSARRSTAANSIEGYAQNVSGLQKFVEEGAVGGSSEVELFGPIFRNKTGSKALKSSRRPPTAILAKKLEQDKEKNILLKKVMQKVKREREAAAAAAAAAAAHSRPGSSSGAGRP